MRCTVYCFIDFNFFFFRCKSWRFLCRSFYKASSHGYAAWTSLTKVRWKFLDSVRKYNIVTHENVLQTKSIVALMAFCNALSCEKVWFRMWKWFSRQPKPVRHGYMFHAPARHVSVTIRLRMERLTFLWTAGNILLMNSVLYQVLRSKVNFHSPKARAVVYFRDNKSQLSLSKSFKSCNGRAEASYIEDMKWLQSNCL